MRACCTRILLHVSMDFESEDHEMELLACAHTVWTHRYCMFRWKNNAHIHVQTVRVHARGASKECSLYVHFDWDTEQRSYEAQRRQPVNPLVVTYFKQAVTQSRLITVTQLLFLASIYVDAFTKLGRNAPQTHIVQESFLPSAFSHGSNPHREVAATVSPSSLFLCWLKLIRAGWTIQFISQVKCILTHTSLLQN